MSGTLTVTQWVEWLAGAGTIVLRAGDEPGIIEYVDDVADPTVRLILTRDAVDSDSVTFRIVDTAGAVLAEADYAVSLAAFEAAASVDVAGAIAVLTGALTTIVLADGAAADLETIKSGLILTGNSEGTTFRVSQSATVDAGDGDDLIVAGAVSDYATIHGGGGDDTLSFADLDAEINLDEEASFVGFAGADFSGEWTFDGIEHFRGSDHNDRFMTAGQGSSFTGGKGGDNFEKLGSGSERDIVDYSGEAGSDGIIVNFGGYLGTDEIAALHADLASALLAILTDATDMAGSITVRDTYGEYDNVFSGYSIIGTSRADVFFGSSDADVFEGRGGADNFFGGEGDDTIDGGDGLDALFLSGAQVGDIGYSNGVFTIESVGGGVDTVRNVETFWFGETEVKASDFKLAVDDTNAGDAVTEAGASGAGDDSAAGNVLDNDKTGGTRTVTKVRAGAGADVDVASGTVVAGTYGSLTISSDGSWTYTLDNSKAATNGLAEGATVEEVFTYRLLKGTDTDEARLTITIAGSNDAPDSSDASVTIGEDSGAYAFSASAFGFVDADAGAQLQSVTITSLPVKGTLALAGVAVVAGQSVPVGQLSQLTYTAPTDANGTSFASFGFTVSDGMDDSAEKHITINVTPAADAPTSMDGSATIAEDESYTFEASDFAFADADAGDQLVWVQITSLPANGQLKLDGAAVVAGTTVAVAQLPLLVFAPNADANGAPLATFGFKVSDGGLWSAEHSFAITVTAANDAPTAGDDSLAGPYLEDEAITIDPSILLANDDDVDGQTPTIVSVSGAQHGSVAIVAGNVMFTPDANYSGLASFTYKVTDGTAQSGATTVSFTIVAVNDAPVTSDKTINVAEDGSYAFSQADFSFSDVDAGDALDAIVVVSLPASGALKLGSVAVEIGDAIPAGQIGQLVYTPPSGASGAGVASFGFKVSDGSLTSAPKTITFDVVADNDAPVANGDSLIVGPYLEDQPIIITSGMLLANDSDPDTGQTLSIASVSGAQHGSVAIVAGNVVFTPDANYAGAASFSYTITDGLLTSNAATVTLNIIAMPDAPVTADRQVTIAEDGSYAFSIADFPFADVDVGDTLRAVKISSLPSAGTLTLGGVAVTVGQSIAVGSIAQLVFTPSANANGSPLASFGFTVSDGVLESAARTFTISVTAANDAPVAASDPGFVTAEDTSLTFTASELLANDSDADGDTLTIASVSSGAGGIAVLNANGTVTFTPNENFAGAASFSYRAKDGAGALSNVATVSVTVTPVNDAPVFSRMLGVGPNAALAFIEGTSEVYTVAASDVDSATLTYSLEGADAGDFVIDSGKLRFKVTPDFEAPADAGGNNVYDVTLVVSDGVLTDRQTLAIAILDAAGNTVVGTGNADTIDLTHKIGLLGATDEADLIRGQAGKDTIDAAAGDDTIQGGAGKDDLDGGAGFDAADYSDKTVSVTATLNGAADARVRVGSVSEDTIRNIEALNGGKAADKLTGDAGANLLSGGSGNDMLSGMQGHDTLTGGKGNDRFVFDAKLKAASADLITDFRHDTDLIVLDGKIVKAIGAKLEAGEFYAKAHATAAHDLDDRIIYNKTTGDLFYDADGNKTGGKNAILFATLETRPTLDAGDFLVV